MVNYREENTLMDTDRVETDNNFTFSCFENDDGLYFDMDFNGNNSPNSESEEFEFSVSVSATDQLNKTGHVCDVSPADDLFYRGQLLPLHLPPRLEMVRNLSFPSEHEADTTTSDTYSSGSRDSNQSPGCCKESRCRPAEKEEKTHIQSIVKSGNKLKVKAPMFGFCKSSKVGMDDFNYSPPEGKPLKFMMKLKCMKVASMPFLTTDYSTKQSPDDTFNRDNRISTSAKHIVKKYVRLVKHRISSQKYDGAHTVDRRLKMDEGCGWPFIAGPCIAATCIADESGRQTHVGFNDFDVDSCLPSMNSSPSFSREDLQSAIDYCKQSNTVVETNRGI